MIRNRGADEIDLALHTLYELRAIAASDDQCLDAWGEQPAAHPERGRPWWRLASRTNTPAVLTAR